MPATEHLSEPLSLAPVINRVLTAGEAIGLQNHELLHAGPPLLDPHNPPPVLMSAAVMTALHEQWADSEEAAEKLVHDGVIQLRCAQNHQCVTPLAATVSSSTPLFEVVDPGFNGAPQYSIVSPIGGADTRMGHRDSTVLARLANRDKHLLPAWQAWLATNGPLPIWPLADAGLEDGDDLHYRTTSASKFLGAALAQQASGDWITAIGQTPTYFLTLWMAACAMLLKASDDRSCPTAVVKAGGNGESFGVSLAKNPNHWFAVPATPPVGAKIPGASNASTCPAIGDSAVIDIAGFGAQGLCWASEAREAFANADVLPSDYAEIASQVGIAELAGLTKTRLTGVDAQNVAATGSTPLIALAMLDAQGQQGLLGRGLYRTDRILFEKSLLS